MASKEAEEYVLKTICDNCLRCGSHGYIGCDTFRYSVKAFDAGVEYHKLHSENNVFAELNDETARSTECNMIQEWKEV